MEKHELRHITYEGYEVQTESAVRDSQGRKLNELRYVFEGEEDSNKVNAGDYVIMSDEAETKSTGSTLSISGGTNASTLSLGGSTGSTLSISGDTGSTSRSSGSGTLSIA